MDETDEIIEDDWTNECEMCKSSFNRFLICDVCLAKILETVMTKKEAQKLVREKVGEWLYGDSFTGKDIIIK